MFTWDTCKWLFDLMQLKEVVPNKATNLIKHQGDCNSNFRLAG